MIVPFSAADSAWHRRASEPLPIFGAVPKSDADLLQLAAGRTLQRDPDVIAKLRSDWSEMELPEASLESLQLLVDPNVQVVIAGQQPALLGGPLMLLSKAITAATIARRLRDQGVPAVPIFWIADEDHDVGELAPGALGVGTAARVASQLPNGRTPIADLRLREDQMEQLIGAVTHAVQPEARQRFESMARATADAAPAVWFRQLLLALLPDAGLLPLHPRQLSPFVAPRLLQEEPGALAAQVATSIAELRSLDLAVPIAEASPLPFFVLDAAGERHRVTPATSDPGALELRDSSGTRFERATLERLAHEEPHRFSPDALMRPLLQDSLLQPLAVVVGPTEYSYHLELASAYAARGIVRPALIPRLRARLLDQSLAAAVRETGIDPEALASERRPLEELVPSPEAEVVVSELESRASSLLAYLNELQQRADITGGAHKRAVRLEQRWRGEIDKFAALLRRDLSGDVTAHRDAVQKALEQLWPGGDDAERTVSVLAAADRYGFDLFAEIAAACDPYDARARLLVQQPLTAHAFEAQSKAN